MTKNGIFSMFPIVNRLNCQIWTNVTMTEPIFINRLMTVDIGCEQKALWNSQIIAKICFDIPCEKLLHWLVMHKKRDPISLIKN